MIVVYRPPSSDFRSFLDDVGKVLLTAAAHPTETVVCGYFNTRYGDPTCTNATNLADLFDTSGFVHCLEMVQRSATRVVMQIRRGDRQSMTTILQRLHWLPVKKRIEFKILVFVHKAIYEGQPVYIASLVNQHTQKRCLRSSSGLLLNVPQVNLERFGRRAFACAGPTLWNNLPTNLRVNGNHTQSRSF